MFNRDIKNKDVNEVSDGFVDDSLHSTGLKSIDIVCFRLSQYLRRINFQDIR